MGKKRVLTLGLVLVFVVLAMAASWIAGSTIKSPAEVAARTAPPMASPILVPVEVRVLASEIIARGTARFGLPKPISIAPSNLKLDAGVISTLPLPKTQLNEGDVVLTASGRPVFLLSGDVPTFRDLVQGTKGDDVLQLESGLERLGFSPGPLDGSYDEQTSAAVAEWYLSMGWEPLAATADQLSNIRALELELATTANRQLTAIDTKETATVAVEAARAHADSVNQIAAADLALKTAAREKIFARQSSTREERTNALADVDAAGAAAVASQLLGDVEIQTAINAQRVAEREAVTLDDLVGRLRSDLELAIKKAGVKVAVDEVVFLPILPVRVQSVDRAVGDPSRGPVLTVTNNQLAIDSSLPLDEASLVKTGMLVAIDEASLGIKATGVIGRVADTPGTFGVDGFHIYFEVLVDETPLSLEGFSLRITVPIESTDGPVTVVPISALYLTADGTSRVQVDNNGTLESLVVEPGLSAKGLVQVTPLGGQLKAGQLVSVGFESR